MIDLFITWNHSFQYICMCALNYFHNPTRYFSQLCLFTLLFTLVLSSVYMLYVPYASSLMRSARVPCKYMRRKLKPGGMHIHIVCIQCNVYKSLDTSVIGAK